MYTEIAIENITSFKIGHAHNEDAATGCTVILSQEGAVTGVDVRSGSPGTREIDLLKTKLLLLPMMGLHVQCVHPIHLSMEIPYSP